MLYEVSSTQVAIGALSFLQRNGTRMSVGRESKAAVDTSDYFDVEKWYGHGPGSLYAGAQYSGYVNEYVKPCYRLTNRLIARLTNTNVATGGAVNSTLDSKATTFPLDKTFYADFTQ